MSLRQARFEASEIGVCLSNLLPHSFLPLNFALAKETGLKCQLCVRAELGRALLELLYQHIEKWPTSFPRMSRPWQKRLLAACQTPPSDHLYASFQHALLDL